MEPKGRKVKYVCEICGSTFEAWYNYKTRTCSAECKSKMMHQRLIDDYSARAGEPIEQFLRRRYIDDVASYREIMADLGVTHVHALKKLMLDFDIPIRHGSEAVKAQWRDNPERRARAREILFASGISPVVGGFNWAKQPGVAAKISKAKTGHPMYRDPLWRKHVCRSIQIREQQKEPTEIERAMQSALESMDLPFQRQRAIDHYTADFTVETNDRKIVIECDGTRWHDLPDRKERDAKRDEIIVALGWTVIRFTDKDILGDIEYCKRLIAAATGH